MCAGIQILLAAANSGASSKMVREQSDISGMVTIVVSFVISTVKKQLITYSIVLCWNHMGIHCDHSLDFSMIISAMEHFGNKFFMQIMAVSPWEIWKQRNAVIFREYIPFFSSWRLCFKDTLKLQLLRVAPELRSEISFWLDSLYSSLPLSLPC